MGHDLFELYIMLDCVGSDCIMFVNQKAVGSKSTVNSLHLGYF